MGEAGGNSKGSDKYCELGMSVAGRPERREIFGEKIMLVRPTDCSQADLYQRGEERREKSAQLSDQIMSGMKWLGWASDLHKGPGGARAVTTRTDEY